MYKQKPCFGRWRSPAINRRFCLLELPVQGNKWSQTSKIYYFSLKILWRCVGSNVNLIIWGNCQKLLEHLFIISDHLVRPLLSQFKYQPKPVKFDQENQKLPAKYFVQVMMMRHYLHVQMNVLGKLSEHTLKITYYKENRYHV